MITLENAWVFVFIVGGLVLMPFLIANIRGESKLSGYKRRAAAAEEYDKMARARGRVVIEGDVHCPHGSIFPDDGSVRCVACEEEGLG